MAVMAIETIDGLRRFIRARIVYSVHEFCFFGDGLSRYEYDAYLCQCSDESETDCFRKSA